MLHPLSTLTFPELHETENLSAIALIDQYILVGADEGHAIQRLEADCDQVYQLKETTILVNDPKTETDIEDICCVGSTCYVIGSHSRKRKKVKPDEKSQAANRDRLYQIPKPEPSREVLFQLDWSPDTEQFLIKKKGSLSDIIHDDQLLKPFIELPSKENGIDIEGLAIQGNRLMIGFRSPVLRGNYVPILSIDANSFDQPQLNFIQMGGRGVRAIAETADGFLIIGGPPGSGEMTYHLYFWNGNDMIPGDDVDEGNPLFDLGDIPVPEGAKAEGLALLAETDQLWQILIVYDGVAGGHPTMYEIQK